MKQDIALPYRKDKKSKRSGIKEWLKKVFKETPKNKLVRVATYASLVLAIAAFILAVIPSINIFGVWLAVLAVALSLFGFFRKDGKLPRKTLIISAAVLIIGIASVTVQNMYQQSLIDHEMYLKSGEATEEILRGDLAVTFGEWDGEGLAVTLNNGNAENKGYNVLVEAKDENGFMIANEMVSVGGIAPGKDAELIIFKRLTDDKKEAMNKATYEVVSVSQF